MLHHPATIIINQILTQFLYYKGSLLVCLFKRFISQSPPNIYVMTVSGCFRTRQIISSGIFLFKNRCLCLAFKNCVGMRSSLYDSTLPKPKRVRSVRTETLHFPEAVSHEPAFRKSEDTPRSAARSIGATADEQLQQVFSDDGEGTKKSKAAESTFSC